MDREELMLYLNENEIQTRPAQALVHEQKPYENFQTYRIETAQELVQKSLCLPSSINLKDYEVDRVIGSLNG